MFQFFFFFNDTATTEIYTLSLHDALPISVCRSLAAGLGASGEKSGLGGRRRMDWESGEYAFSRVDENRRSLSREPAPEEFSRRTLSQRFARPEMLGDGMYSQAGTGEGRSFSDLLAHTG